MMLLWSNKFNNQQFISCIICMKNVSVVFFVNDRFDLINIKQDFA